MTRSLAPLALALALAACAKNADGRPDASAPGATPVAAPAVSATPASAPATPSAPDTLLGRADLGRILGSNTAKVWMIVVSDFQCPYCREFHAAISEPLRKQYVQTGKVRIAYLNFPLGQHQHAWPAAEVAMCAGVQGKFWPVHDAIFATQASWNKLDAARGAAYFDSLAVARGVDAKNLRACVASKGTRPLIQADYERSQKTGVRSTPTIIIGSELMPGVYPIEAYRKVLDSAIAQSARP